MTTRSCGLRSVPCPTGLCQRPTLRRSVRLEQGAEMDERYRYRPRSGRQCRLWQRRADRGSRWRTRIVADLKPFPRHRLRAGPPQTHRISCSQTRLNLMLGRVPRYTGGDHKGVNPRLLFPQLSSFNALYGPSLSASAHAAVT